MAQSEKPIRLYFDSYLQLIHNSLGSNMFRNLYVHTSERGDFDALDDGNNSCAFYVSSILVLFKKLGDIHGTIEGTLKDLQASGWVEVARPQPGDVLVWEARKFDNDAKKHKHIGFSIGNGQAVSMSWSEKVPIEHGENFGPDKRKIIQIFRIENWDQ